MMLIIVVVLEKLGFCLMPTLKFQIYKYETTSMSTLRAGINLFTQNCSSIAQSGCASATP